MKISRVAFVACVVALATASGAAAYVPVDRGATAPQSTGFADGTSYADIAAHREVLASRHWAQAADAAVSPVIQPSGGSAWIAPVLLIAGLALALLALALLTRPMLARRRSRAGAIA